MIALLLSVALAQDVRHEMTITDADVGGSVTTPVRAYTLDEEYYFDLFGGGGGSGNPILDPVVVQREVDALSSVLADGGGLALDTVVLRTLGPHPTQTGQELVRVEITLRGVVIGGARVTSRADDPSPRERLELIAQCATLQSWGYDANGAQTGTSTATWDFATRTTTCSL